MLAIIIIILYINSRQLVQTVKGAELRVLWSYPDVMKRGAPKPVIGEDERSGDLQGICLLWFGHEDGQTNYL